MSRPKKILFIYWAKRDFSIIRNIVNTLNEEGYIVVEDKLNHVKNSRLFISLGINISNNNIINIIYLFINFLKLNIKSLFYRDIFVLGPNAIYSVLFGISLNKKIIFHYNELPSFIEQGLFKLKSKIDFYLFNKVKYIVVSNEYRLKLFKEIGHHRHEYFILDNILNLSEEKVITVSTTIKNNNQINLMYTGVLNSNRMIEQLIRTIGESSRFNLILAGYTDDENRLMKLIGNYKNVIYKGVLKQSDVLKLIESSCDFGIAFYSLYSLNNRYCAPLKIHEYFNFNKLVISLKNPPLIEIENKFEIIYTINNIEELLSKLEFSKIQKRLINVKNSSFELFKIQQNEKFLFEMNKIIELIKT